MPTDFNRTWNQFWVDAEIDHFGSKRLVASHNTMKTAMQAKLDAQAEELATLRKGLEAVSALMKDSEGIAGLHVNGDIATWDELRTGGRFEEWLMDFDAALTGGSNER